MGRPIVIVIQKFTHIPSNSPDEKISSNFIIIVQYSKYILIATVPYFSAEYEKNHSPMGHYVSTYYKSTYQKDYNSSESHQSFSPGERNPFYTTVTGQTPTPDNFHF